MRFGTRSEWRVLRYALGEAWKQTLPAAIWASFPSIAFGIWQGSLAASLFVFFVIWPVWIRMAAR